MKTKTFFITMLLLCPAHLKAQGWVAEISVNINHGGYAQEIINTGSVTFGGQTIAITNQIAPVQITITGTNLPSGQLDVSVSGTAQFPYPTNPPNNLPATQAIVGNYMGVHNFNCVSSDYAGVNANEFNGTIRLYPRVTIGNPNYTGACSDRSVTLTANSCFGYQWGISSTNGGPYFAIPGQTNSSLAVTRELVSSMGFGSSVVNFYVTVIGRALTRSEQRTITLFAPPPQFNTSKIDPVCNDGKGTINVNISPGSPEINNFTVYLFEHSSGAAFDVHPDSPTSTSFSNLPGGDYWIQVRNNTNTGTLGDCYSASSWTSNYHS